MENKTPSKYTTKYVQDVPLTGSPCPTCGQGYLERGIYGGMLCKKCRTAFKKDKYSPRKVTPTGEPPKGAIKEMKPFTANIATKDDIKRLEEKIDKLLPSPAEPPKQKDFIPDIQADGDWKETEGYGETS